MTTMADILRGKSGASKSRARGLQFQDMANSAGPAYSSGGMVQGMGGVASPTPGVMNWGNIAQKGLGNYMAAKENKKASEEEARIDELGQQFMKDTLGGDPEAMKLFKMTQMGVPGADKALADHLTPKKQSLAVLMQAVTSGQLDPDMAAEVAPQFGISPEMARKSATYALETKEKAAEREFKQKAALKSIGRGSTGASSNKLSFQDYLNLPPEQQEAYERFSGRKGAKDNSMTPGERNERAKALQKMDKAVEQMEASSAKFDALRPKLEDPKAFGAKQTTAQVLAEMENPILSAIGTSMRSETSMLLEDYLNDEVLDRMAQLGGNDSNEELNRMRASLPKVLNNQEAALALMDQLHQWQQDTKEAMRRRRQDMQSGEYFSPDAQAKDYYREVRQGRALQLGDVPKNMDKLTGDQPKPKIKILSIE